MKIIPLPLAQCESRIRLTKAEREARVQAHMARVHPKIDAIRREEAAVSRRTHYDAKSRQETYEKGRDKLLAKARLRAAAIAGRRTT